MSFKNKWRAIIGLLCGLLLALPSLPLALASEQCEAEVAPSEALVFPILKGDYADPSVLKDGNTFYMVHSSFEYYPGLQIWQSDDLFSWRPVTHALTQYVGSVWAPDLIKHQGRYYIYFPASGKNYVVYADKIEGPWSEPVELASNAIDPGHVTDEQGNRYLYFNDGSYVPLAADGLSIIGEPQRVYAGWPIPKEWIIECFCLESPKLMKHGGYYYLTAAQGETAGPASGHMIVSARAKSPLGPWQNSPHNPLIRAESGAEKWWSKGHGTPVEDNHGQWWMVYHGYEKGHHNLGRQTLLTPMIWTQDGWLKADQQLEPATVAKLEQAADAFSQPIHDQFVGANLAPYWHFWGAYDKSRIRLANKSLTLKAKGKAFKESSPLLMKPSDHSYEVSVSVTLTGKVEAALLLYYSDQAFSGISTNGEQVSAVIRGWVHPTDTIEARTVHLKMVKECQLVHLYFSTDGSNWHKSESSLEVASLNHNALSGFFSLQLGLAAVGEGEVIFKDFRYQPR